MGYNLEKLRFVFEILAFRSKMRKHFVLRIIYGVKVMPECHKKKFDFLWKNKSGKKACVQEIQNFFFLRSVQGHRNQ